MYFFNANVLAVLAAAVLQWLFGGLWYGIVFSKPYKVLVGAPDGRKQGNTAGVLGLIFITNIIVAFALAQIIMLSHVTRATTGIFISVVCGLGFVVPSLLALHVSEGKPFKLFGINSIYWLIAMGLSGCLLVYWH
jgi:hypothetical protein